MNGESETQGHRTMHDLAEYMRMSTQLRVKTVYRDLEAFEATIAELYYRSTECGGHMFPHVVFNTAAGRITVPLRDITAIEPVDREAVTGADSAA